MKKLWKVRVNNWGCSSPRTKYFESREEAQKCANQHPAADKVEYAGRFTDSRADSLTGKCDSYD